MQAKLTERGFDPDAMACTCAGTGSIDNWDGTLTPCPFHADPLELAKWRLEQAAGDLKMALHAALFFVPLGTNARAAADAAIAKAEGRS